MFRFRGANNLTHSDTMDDTEVAKTTAKTADDGTSYKVHTVLTNTTEDDKLLFPAEHDTPNIAISSDSSDESLEDVSDTSDDSVARPIQYLGQFGFELSSAISFKHLSQTSKALNCSSKGVTWEDAASSTSAETGGQWSTSDGECSSIEENTDDKENEDEARFREAHMEWKNACRYKLATSDMLKGLQYAGQNNYTSAIRKWTQASEAGHAKAKFNLALCYELGKGVSRDTRKATQYYQEAANLDHAKAMHNLAVHHIRGEDDPSQAKTERASRLLKQSAERGVAQANAWLGYLYIQGTQRDDQKAVDCFKLAADEKNHWGQYFLGVCYEEGVGVIADCAEALKLYRLASESGNEEASRCYDALKAKDSERELVGIELADEMKDPALARDC